MSSIGNHAVDAHRGRLQKTVGLDGVRGFRPDGAGDDHRVHDTESIGQKNFPLLEIDAHTCSGEIFAIPFDPRVGQGQKLIGELQRGLKSGGMFRREK